MAPRAPESRVHFFRRLRSAIAQGQTEVRFGYHHFSHAVCVEDGLFRIRKLELTAAKANAYLEQHGAFMPEHAEALSTPGELVFEGASLDAVVEELDKSGWPLTDGPPVRPKWRRWLARLFGR